MSLCAYFIYIFIISLIIENLANDDITRMTLHSNNVFYFWFLYKGCIKFDTDTDDTDTHIDTVYFLGDAKVNIPHLAPI